MISDLKVIGKLNTYIEDSELAGNRKELTRTNLFIQICVLALLSVCYKDPRS